MNYAIIGDVHGMLKPLELLLKKLGFIQKQGVYQHDDYKAVFLGDLVDRGKDQRGVLELVRGMVEAGHAYAIMGNHEYNAVGFHIKNPKTGQFLVKHEQYRTDMHEAFNHDYPVGEAHSIDMALWLRSLPIFIEFDDFRVVHACWDQAKVDIISPYLNKNNQLDAETFVIAFDKTSELYKALSRLIRGATIKLSDDSSITDDFGKSHKNVRVKWWNNRFETWFDLLTRASDAEQAVAANMVLPKNGLDDLRYPKNARPVFFGHYWFQGVPAPLRHNMACLDYCACVGGELVAYDWQTGDKPRQNGLRADRFITVQSDHFECV